MANLFLFKSLMAVAALIIITSSLVFAYQTTVDVGAKECFFERLATTDKLAIVYDVVDGGFRDLAFSLSAPEGGDLVSADDNDPSSSSSGRYTFAAAEEGEYRWCFDNGNNGRGRSFSATPKVVKFAVEVFVSPSSSAASKNASKAVDQDPDHADRLAAVPRRARPPPQVCQVRVGGGGHRPRCSPPAQRASQPLCHRLGSL